MRNFPVKGFPCCLNFLYCKHTIHSCHTILKGYDPAAINLLASEFRSEQPAKATQSNNSGEREEVLFTKKETLVIPGQGWAGPGWADTYGCPGVVWAGLG